jgi:hypothetical protein
MAYNYEQLRKLSTTDLVREHDAVAERTQVGTNYYLEEIARRDNARIAHQMFWMTLAITVCTAVMTALTVVLVRRAP